MLTRAVRDKWAADLRSGEYEQYFCGYFDLGKALAFRDGSRTKPPPCCALSVLIISNGLLDDYFKFDILERLKEVLGIDQSDSILITGLNDVNQMSFSEIANRVDTLEVCD